MGTGDSPEMQRMQDEAIERAREMRRRAQLPPTEDEMPEERSAEKAADQSTAAAEPEFADAEEPLSHEPPDSVPSVEEASDQPPAHVDASKPVTAAPLPSMLDNLFKNHEQTLILILLILIGGESQNHELMFALLFLLM